MSFLVADPARTVADAAAATGVFSLTWLLIGFPVLGAAVLLLGGRRTNAWGHWFGVLMPAASFVVAVALFLGLLGRDPGQRAIRQHLFSWVPAGRFQVDLALLLDPLSMAFVLLVTFVGTLIHLYSVGYMAHDPNRRRFFGYMNLFVAAMLLLVLGDNYLSLYAGWEGVGLASYLLIGFWSYKPSAATAAKKAFVVNRVGDAGLTLAIIVMFATLGTTSFAGVFTAADRLGAATATAIGLLLLLGACGKSAQFPLQTWLLDAMEGPTPVSALIHAATMVTAGVYLIVRSNPIFDAAPDARLAVLVVGALTLLIGAIIGTAYDDIKKVLAASTMSQIGYMVLATGLGPAGYAFGIAHLLTHGFFKATMFLGAGSVMHAMNDQVDMRRFGGLRTVLPVTFVTFLIGYLAIIGIPPFAGFFSKDKIIEAAFATGGASGTLFGAVALLGAGITAFYMTRLMVMTFFGRRRWTEDVHPHEAPAVMTAPMAVLALGSAVAGYALIWAFPVTEWLAPVVGTAEEGHGPVSPLVMSALTLIVVAGGVLGAVVAIGRRPVPVVAPADVSFGTRAARQGLYGDAVNEAVFMRPGQYLTRLLVYFDNRGVDGIVNGLAAAIGGTSGRVRRFQTGFVRSYALAVVGGAALVVATVLVVRMA